MGTVVAAAKLSIPRSRQPFVPRPALAARLDADCRMALVSAPAGCGKTATLSSWALERRDSVAWLSCDSSDADPSRFMSCLLSAISGKWPGVADDAFVLLDRDGGGPYDAAIAVANELAGVADPGVIVVDDLHLANHSRTVLPAFVGALPAHFRFITGARTDPPWSLARLRLGGELVEVRGDDLRFDVAELAQFLELREVPMSSDEILRLHELTEGWPAGAQLATIALRRGVGYDAFLGALASTDRAVGDFLVNEVLSGMPPEVDEFLLETSVLDAFDAELCEAVTGTGGADRILETLLTNSLFVVPLDERAHWYRYHHLFGAFLRARLASRGRSRLLAAHDRASRALEARGDTAAALQHCMAVGGVERAGEVIRATIQRFMSVSDCADAAELAIRQWLHDLGSAFIVTDPVCVVEFVHQLIILTGADDAPSWLERVRRAHPDAEGELAAAVAAAWTERHLRLGHAEAALASLRVAMDAIHGEPPNVGLLPLLHASLACAHIHAGDLEQADAVLQPALTQPAGRPVADLVHHPGVAAFVAAASCELAQADLLARRTMRSADQLGLGRHELGPIYARLALMVAHVERNELDAALQIMDEVKQASDESRRLTARCLVTLHESRLTRALGDEAVARELLTQARLFYAEPDASVRRVFDEEAVEQALRFDPSAAGVLIALLDQDRVETQVLRAKLALVDNDDRLASTLLVALSPPVTRRARVERSVLLALSVLERDIDQANLHLADALRLGQPEGLIRTIVDQGAHVHKLLLSCPPQDGQAPYVEALLAVTSHMVAPVRARRARKLPEPLSDREVTVLRYLCSHLTYREIAAALYVSLNTLKSHVRSVFRKLGVDSRDNAITAGRECGLV